MAQNIPEPFKKKIEVDKVVDELKHLPIIQFETASKLLKEQRKVRIECQDCSRMKQT